MSTDLTVSEEKIARLVAKGYSNRGIANAVGLTEGTVKAYISSIFEKARCSNRTELAACVFESRLPLPDYRELTEDFAL